jgi:hypothetical protein
MPSYLWDASDRPLLGAMSATANLDDHAPGDHLSGETASDSDSSPTCTSLEAAADLTAVVDFGSVVSVNAWRFTAGFTVDSDAIARCLGYGVTTSGGAYEVEYSVNGTAWTSHASGVLIQATFQDFSGDLGGVSARYVRLVLHGIEALANVFTATDPLSVTVDLSDFRVVEGSAWTLPFLSWAGSGTVGIVGSGAWTLPFLTFAGEGTVVSPHGCGCTPYHKPAHPATAFRRPGRATTTYTQSARRTTTWRGRRC